MITQPRFRQCIYTICKGFPWNWKTIVAWFTLAWGPLLRTWPRCQGCQTWATSSRPPWRRSCPVSSLRFLPSMAMMAMVTMEMMVCDLIWKTKMIYNDKISHPLVVLHHLHHHVVQGAEHWASVGEVKCDLCKVWSLVANILIIIVIITIITICMGPLPLLFLLLTIINVHIIPSKYLGGRILLPLVRRSCSSPEPTCSYRPVEDNDHKNNITYIFGLAGSHSSDPDHHNHINAGTNLLLPAASCDTAEDNFHHERSPHLEAWASWY